MQHILGVHGAGSKLLGYAVAVPVLVRNAYVECPAAVIAHGEQQPSNVSITQ